MTLRSFVILAALVVSRSFSGFSPKWLHTLATISLVSNGGAQVLGSHRSLGSSLGQASRLLCCSSAVFKNTNLRASSGSPWMRFDKRRMAELMLPTSRFTISAILESVALPNSRASRPATARASEALHCCDFFFSSD